MSTIKETLTKEFEELERLRDQLKVQAHLAKIEARDALERLEGRWPAVEAKVRSLSTESSHALDTVAKATRDLISELREGYQKILKDRSS